MKSSKLFSILSVILILTGSSCNPKTETKDLASVPAWAKEAIWYQIFVERFRNGDPTNDPTPADMKGAYPGSLPDNWKVTPWGHDWYSHEAWLDSVKAKGFYSKIQARRYGGDLQGVLDKLDYLQELGITAIYFNPLNDSPSLHKYDARNYTHIDRNFGPDPEGDAAMMDLENHGKPSSWHWTAADKMFLKVIEECHKRGIRLIMDYSWNHTGPEFWAMKDIRAKGEKSEYREWYNIKEYDNPSTPQNELRYEGWGGNNPWMPVFRKDIIPPDDKVMPFEGNLHSETLREHIFDVSRRWLDPDHNGNPEDGVDGFRLEVAGEVPMDFWRDYRKVVRSVNPNAYIIGEIWWLEWPDKLLDPKVFLEGDQYDAIMNYRWFRVARGFFAQAEPILTPSGFVSEIARINSGIKTDNLQVMMNVAATHDSPRLSTSFYNKTMDKYNAKPSDNPEYKINKPDSLTRKEQKLLLVHQFTFIGAPHIWYGDEVGMWGADDPDCRKPMVWSDISYEDEKANFDPLKPRPTDVVKPDTTLLRFYKKLSKIRKENPELVYGDLKFTIVDDEKMVLAYTRSYDNKEILVVFNRSDKPQHVDLKITELKAFTILLDSDGVYGRNLEPGTIGIVMEPISALVIRGSLEKTFNF
ncbi:MAG: glycoside hydrolase family 13 protein [Bacteroidia bacterium]|nr:glycoside hydrolase family 13 protein [Bacteroidia bacterium]